MTHAETQSLIDGLRAMVKEIIREEAGTMRCTPADFRTAKGLTMHQLSERLKENGVSLKVDQLRKYEARRVDNVNHASVNAKIRAICQVLDCEPAAYRDAMKRGVK